MGEIFIFLKETRAQMAYLSDLSVRSSSRPPSQVSSDTRILRVAVSPHTADTLHPSRVRANDALNAHLAVGRPVEGPLANSLCVAEARALELELRAHFRAVVAARIVAFLVWQP